MEKQALRQFLRNQAQAQIPVTLYEICLQLNILNLGGIKMSKLKKQFNIFNIIGYYFLILSLTYFPIQLDELVSKTISKFTFYGTTYSVPLLLIIIGIIFLSLKYIKLIHNYHILNLMSFIFLILGSLFLIYKKPDINIGKLDITKYILTPGMFLIVYMFRKKAIINYVKLKNKKSSSNYDDEIKSNEEDKLNRDKLAKRVFKIINNASNEETLRLGIYGKWGTGKTSLMKLIDEKCQDKEIPTVWFNPWHYKNNDELWAGFRCSLEEGIIEFKRGFMYTNFIQKIKLLSLGVFNAIVFKDEKLNFSFEKLLNELMNNAGTPKELEIKRQIQNYLEINVNSDKIVVFIDDLDRIDEGKRIIDLLKWLKELVNFKGFIFLIGIDHNIIEKVIEKELSTSDNNFLEKIIDYPIYLPKIVDNEIDELLDNELNTLEELDYNIKKDTIYKIKEYLPRNPRSLKRYLRYLGILSPTFARFSDEELKWSFLYLAQLLGLEFPNVLRNIIDKEECQQIFDYSTRVLEAIFDGNENDNSDKLKEEEENKLDLLLEDASQREINNRNQLKELIDAMSNIDITKEKILFYFRIVEYPGLLTWKEFKENYFIKINENISIFNQLEFENKKEYLRKILKYREKILRQMSKVTMEKERLELHNEVLKINEQLNELLNLINKSNIKSNISDKFLSTIFKELLYQYSSYLSFGIDNEVKIKNQEKELFINMISKKNMDPKPYLEVLKPWLPEEEPYQNKEYYLELKSKLVGIVEEKLSNELNKNFLIKNGIQFSTDRSKNMPQKWLLFRKSVFHNEENYKKIANLSELAKENNIIQENFYKYLKCLIQFSKQTVFFTDIDGTKELLRNEDFLKLIWPGIIANPLNKQSLYYLKGYIIELEESILNDNFENIINDPYPDWWRRVEKQIEDWD